MKRQNDSRDRVRWLCVCAMLMAVNIVMSSFSVPVPGGHLYLNDIIIDTAALLLDPLGAFLVGGVGAFLGDFFFYPAPMFVSLVTRGAQAAVIALLMRRSRENEALSSVPPLVLGALLGIVGFTLGRAYVYGTPAAALLKLPYQVLMGVGGALIAWLLCWKCGLAKAYRSWRGSVE